MQVDNSIVITRKEPVTYYNPIALPPSSELRTKMIEESRYTQKYQITLEEKRLSAAQRRFIRACETLARVRKLSRNTPALQFNIATSGGQQVNLAK